MPIQTADRKPDCFKQSYAMSVTRKLYSLLFILDSNFFKIPIHTVIQRRRRYSTTNTKTWTEHCQIPNYKYKNFTRLSKPGISQTDIKAREALRHHRKSKAKSLLIFILIISTKDSKNSLDKKADRGPVVEEYLDHAM
jgi:hypothetical protein